MNWAVVSDVGILGPAFVAGLIVLLTHVPLGRQVLIRGIIFIDLAIAHIAGLGVIAAHGLAAGPDEVLVQFGAFGAAIMGSLALYGAERRWPEVQEATIGATFVLTASITILFLAGDPRGGKHLHDLLAGQILWVDFPRLLFPLVLSSLILALWSIQRIRNNTVAFYLLFAVSVTMSVQLVGIYLVFASLIIPALGSRCFSTRRIIPMAFLIGITGYGTGLILSALLDLPAGPVIVWTLAVSALLINALGVGRLWINTRRKNGYMAGVRTK